jgi:hypothetical protein
MDGAQARSHRPSTTRWETEARRLARSAGPLARSAGQPGAGRPQKPAAGDRLSLHFGLDLSAVPVHTDAAAMATARWAPPRTPSAATSSSTGAPPTRAPAGAVTSSRTSSRTSGRTRVRRPGRW